MACSLRAIAVAALVAILMPVAACKKKPSNKVAPPRDESDSASSPISKSETAPSDKKPHHSSRAPYPRRMLAIGISNYSYANPIRYGRLDAVRDSERRDVAGVFARLATYWKIPSAQAYYIADIPGESLMQRDKHPPLKTVVEETIERFLETSRKQDRLVIVFAGHAVEKGGEAYLVPLDGELDDALTLIPLKEVYAKVEKCPAQQKLFIFDVCRFDPGRKPDRPAFGAMTPALEKALHQCPKSTTVWTSCSAGQFSYEFAQGKVNTRELPKFEIFGSVFLNVFLPVEVPWIREKWQTESEGSVPDDELPIAMASELVDSSTTEVVKILQKKSQTPKITTNPIQNSAAYDPKEKLARTFELPTARPVVKNDMVVAIFKEIGLPPLRAIQNDGKVERVPDNIPFPMETMKEYADQGPTFEEIRTARAKYLSKFPLRVAAVDAFVEIRKQALDSSREKWPSLILSPLADAEKKRVVKFQRSVTTQRESLEEIKGRLDEAMAKKDMEKSKRWLAHIDLAYAEVRLRLALMYEYNLALSKVKGDGLPELDAKLNQKNWHLEPNEKLSSPKEVRDMSEEGKTALAELVKQHPDTPWAVLAKSHQKAELGLRWSPAQGGK